MNFKRGHFNVPNIQLLPCVGGKVKKLHGILERYSVVTKYFDCLAMCVTLQFPLTC